MSIKLANPLKNDSNLIYSVGTQVVALKQVQSAGRTIHPSEFVDRHLALGPLRCRFLVSC